MAKFIAIERPNGTVTIVRSELETPSENPLTEHEEIINELYSKVKNLDIQRVIDCSTCKHQKVSKYVEPCYGCRDNDSYDHYESVIGL